MGQFSWGGLAEWVEKQILHRVEQIRVIDFIDIIILAVVTFMIIKFIVERRAARIAIGVMFIMVASALTTILDMKAMMFLFQKLTQIGLIALVVMFQPELRAVLAKIGKISIPNIKHISNDMRNTEYITKNIDILAETACDFSMKKTGALIVIERDTKLGEHIKTGTVINAQLSGQLLKNLFYDKAPLHDGAVILRNYRVFSAGCVLPLSFKDDIDKSLGTRHRAAIGITEMSDAIVLVVSEETGMISIVHNGIIKQNFTYKTLKSELIKLLLPQENVKSSKRNKNKKVIGAAKEDNI